MSPWSLRRSEGSPRPTEPAANVRARTIVFGEGRGDRYRVGRTLRALVRAGLAPEDLVCRPIEALAEALAAAREPVWLVRAGAWPVATGPISFPRPSATGRPLCALGAERSTAWSSLLAATGGDLDPGPRLPSAPSVYLEARLAHSLAARLRPGRNLPEALEGLIRDEAPRLVRVAALDVRFEEDLRVAQVVTSLQQGGAERVAIALAGEVPARGIRTLLVALGGPTRAAFPPPPGTLDLSWERLPDAEERSERLVQLLVSFGADLVHAHLLEGADVSRLARAGLPLLLTIHNVRPGWPAGTEALRQGEVALLVGCSRAAEEDLRAARLPAPTRTVWNGADFEGFAPTAERLRAARQQRRQLGFGDADFVLLAVANPRPQKRLHLLPEVLASARAELRRRRQPREARLVFAGGASRGSDTARAAEERIRSEVARLGLDEHVRFVGSVDDPPPLLLAADVLVSVSAYEGLSLAHLEALAAGIPVVATDVGGTAEAARGNPAFFLAPTAAVPDRLARVLADVAQSPPPSGRAHAEVHFTRGRMAEAYARLYPRAVEAARGTRGGDGLLLVTNNFSTGGAQSSARRLLLGLAGEGVRVRAAVLEEQPEYPTPGRRALLSSGIPVLSLPAPGSADAAAAVAALLEEIDEDPPAAVLLWNAIPEHKILLADGLLDIPLFDVSPGEMYFASLDRYFARPRPGLPYRTPAEYGARLAGVVVKYRGEAARAAETLRAPVHIIPNGIPLDGAPAPRSRDSNDLLVIGTLARLDPRKKVEELLRALRLADGRLPPHVLRIAGGVERGCAGYAAELRRIAEGLAVEWVGEVEDTRAFLRGLDLFALVAEPAGCPNASLEAMAEGLAVVATDVGGLREQVEDGITGRVVDPEDAEALASALASLAGDPAARTRLGDAARARVEASFDLRRMVADYRRLCLGACPGNAWRTCS